jgi:hypothetical protein
MSEGRREPSPTPPSEQPSEDTLVGPLLVEHHRKDDGRSLILYREAGSSQPTNAVPPAGDADG